MPKKKGVSQKTREQLTFPRAPCCHVKGCPEPVVGVSIIGADGSVCRQHNELEWAAALAHCKDGYWRTFGQRWLRELNARIREQERKIYP